MSTLEEKFAQLGGLRPVGSETFEPVSLGEVASLEDRLKVRLPEPYRAFIMKYGASSFNDYTDYAPSKELPKERYPSGKGHFALFYGSDAAGGGDYGLHSRMNYFAGRIPDDYIPIGDNGMGDQIVLAIKGPDAGGVFVWDLEEEPLDDGDYLQEFGKPMPVEEKLRNLNPIADSFDDFLRRLETA